MKFLLWVILLQQTWQNVNTNMLNHIARDFIFLISFCKMADNDRWRWIQRDGSYILGKVLKLHRLWRRIYCSFCEWKTYVHQLVSFAFMQEWIRLEKGIPFPMGMDTSTPELCLMLFYFQII